MKDKMIVYMIAIINMISGYESKADEDKQREKKQTVGLAYSVLELVFCLKDI